VAKHLRFQNCVRHVLWGEQHWQHDGFAELSSVGPDLLASVGRPLVEEQHVEAICILRQRAKTSFAAILVDDECRGQHLGGEGVICWRFSLSRTTSHTEMQQSKSISKA
jgi:hypothetical protein